VNLINNIEATKRTNLSHLEILLYLTVSTLSLWLLILSNIKINRWRLAIFKNIIKFKLLWIAEGVFLVGNIFLLHVMYKMHRITHQTTTAQHSRPHQFSIPPTSSHHTYTHINHTTPYHNISHHTSSLQHHTNLHPLTPLTLTPLYPHWFNILQHTIPLSAYVKSSVWLSFIWIVREINIF